MQVRKLDWCPPALLSHIRAAVRLLGARYTELDCNKRFRAAMRRLGFRTKYHSGAGDSDTQWISRKHKLILKLCCICTRIIPVNAIPTLVLRSGGRLQDKLLLQPLADLSDIYSVENFIDNRVANMSRRRTHLLYGMDRHCNNVGMYEGRPVVIDW